MTSELPTLFELKMIATTLKTFYIIFLRIENFTIAIA